jgi:hypothetical protein
MTHQRRIDAVLLCLIALDASISVAAFASPSLWYSVFHGAAYVDPQGLLRRMAANWAAFALVQTAALSRWRAKPYWLTIVAGARLGDMFTDWTCLYFCRDITRFGRIGFFLASPLNVLIGWYLIRSYLRLRPGDRA